MKAQLVTEIKQTYGCIRRSYWENPSNPNNVVCDWYILILLIFCCDLVFQVPPLDSIKVKVLKILECHIDTIFGLFEVNIYVNHRKSKLPKTPIYQLLSTCWYCHLFCLRLCLILFYLCFLFHSHPTFESIGHVFAISNSNILYAVCIPFLAARAICKTSA